MTDRLVNQLLLRNYPPPLSQADKIEEWEKNPKKMLKEMKKQGREMEKMMSSPEMMESIKQTTENIVELMTDPEKLEAALQEIVKELEEWDTDLLGSDKIEEARKMLLDGTIDTNSNPSLKSIFGGEKMRDLLNDRERFTETIQERQHGRGRRGGIADEI